MRHSIWVLSLAGCFLLPSASMADEQRGNSALTASSFHETNGAEAIQIERMARFYRIQNYEMNRLDRAEYNRRGDELQRQLDAWEDAGRNPDRTRELLQWLSGALGDTAALQPSSRPAEPLPAPRDAGVEPQTTSPPTISAELAPELSGEKANHAVDVPHPAPSELGIQSKPAPLPEDPTLIHPPEPNSVATPTAPKLSAKADDAAGSSILGGIRSTIDDLVKRVEQVPAISKMPDSVPPPVTLPELADVPDAPPFVSPAFQPQTEPKLNIDLPKVGGLAELRSSATRPASKAGSTTSGDEGRVNFTEVAALTRGYNASLQELETKLSKGSDWTVDQLEPLVDELDDLALRRADLTLYDNALPAEERSQLTSRETLDQAVRLMGKRIAEVRKSLTEQAPGSAESRHSLTRLDGFSRRLAVLGGAK